MTIWGKSHEIKGQRKWGRMIEENRKKGEMEGMDKSQREY